MKVIKIVQTFPRQSQVAAEHVASRVSTELTWLDRSKLTGKVGIGVGSRGIANLPSLVAQTVSFVRECGGEPIILPLMGSHGSSTAEGQQAFLAGYGVSETSMGCRIDARLETSIFGQTAEGYDIYFPDAARECSALLFIARVNRHPSIVGYPQSGPTKMGGIGLGKPSGAAYIHQVGDLAENAPGIGVVCKAITTELLRRNILVGAVAVVDNASGGTGIISALTPENWFTREAQLLRISESWSPQLPWRAIDFFWLREMGKDIDGTGMASYLVSRRAPGVFRHERMKKGEYDVALLGVSGLSAKSHGSAHGIGFADFATARLLAAEDKQATDSNARISKPELGKFIGREVRNDRGMLELATAERLNSGPFVFAKNTKELSVFYASMDFDPRMLGENFAISGDSFELPVSRDGFIELDFAR